MKNFSHEYIDGLVELLNRFPHSDFDNFIQIMLEAYKKEKRIFVMGNGGSASTASHWVCDMNKGCCLALEKKFKMLCLNDSISSMLAYGNDLSYNDIFVEQLKNFFEPGDIVMGISGSGNSENVIRAIDYAGKNGGKTIGLVGYSGGRLKGIVDLALWADIHDMQKVEDLHMIIVHMCMQRIDKELNGCKTISA